MENIRYLLEVAFHKGKQVLVSIAGEATAEFTQLMFRSYRSRSAPTDDPTSGIQPPSHDRSDRLPPI